MNSKLTIVQEFMSQSVVTIGARDSVQTALRKLGDEKISALPVTDAAGAFVGIVTIADFLRTVISTDKALDSEYPHFDDCLWAVDLVQRRLGSDPICSVMTEVVATVSPEDSMQQAAQIMLHNRVHHLPVVTSQGKLVGVLSTTDFVKLACD